MHRAKPNSLVFTTKNHPRNGNKKVTRRQFSCSVAFTPPGAVTSSIF